MRYKAVIEYDGTGYCGWQLQPRVRTVQGEVESAIFRMSGEVVNVTASGRTDSGVHAIGQTIHFDINKAFDPRRLMSGLNFHLPQDIRVKHAEEAGPDFHARFGTTRKTYIYVMYKSVTESALLKNRAVRLDPDADIRAMELTAREVVGEHDFKAFMGSGSSAKTTVRTIYESFVGEHDGLIIYTVTANGFLYNMVRIITGLLIRAGKGLLMPEEVKSIIEAGERGNCRDLAPACGLYLLSAEY